MIMKRFWTLPMGVLLMSSAPSQQINVMPASRIRYRGPDQL